MPEGGARCRRTITATEEPAMENATVERRRARANDVQTLEQLNRGYVRAAQASDAFWFDKNLAPCFMSSNPDGSLVDRSEFLSRIGRPSPNTNMAPVDTRIRIVGDVGIIDSGFQYTKPDGQDGVGHYTDVYGFVDGRCSASPRTLPCGRRRRRPGPRRRPTSPPAPRVRRTTRPWPTSTITTSVRCRSRMSAGSTRTSGRSS
jgi:hypothetical protein